MSDEELNALVEKMDRLEGDHGYTALILCEEAASAIRQLMRERDEARQDAEAAWGTITENGYSS